MNIWEICIIIIMASICVCGGIGFVYASIVNTIERFQIRKAKRDWQLFVKMMEQIPVCLIKTIELIEKKEKESSEKFRKDLMRELEETDPDVFNPEK